MLSVCVVLSNPTSACDVPRCVSVNGCQLVQSVSLSSPYDSWQPHDPELWKEEVLETDAPTETSIHKI